MSGHPYSEAWAHSSASVYYALCGEFEASLSEAESAVQLAREFAFPLVEGVARFLGVG